MQKLLGLTIDEWLNAYQQGTLSPKQALNELLSCCSPDDPAWISLVNAQQLDVQLEALAIRFKESGEDFSQFPLYGVPFAIKDNIDAVGLPTTAACPEFSYLPEQDASVVKLLRQAGAIVMGKTNLDQFATGLVGTRSPYGVVPNTFDADYISGGSSSGSASVVARGLVAFALGTDTAGSGRVPAGFNNIVGLKPSRGALSSAGLIPACRTLDCISVFALNVEDAQQVFDLCVQHDSNDPFSREFDSQAPRTLPKQPVFGIPEAINWYGDSEAEQAFENTLRQLTAMGVQIKKLDFQPLHELAALLYEGPWVAERRAALSEIYQTRPDAIHPVVRHIIEQADNFSAVDYFNASYRKQSLLREAQHLMSMVDALCVPTTPTIYRIEQVQQSPLMLNSHLGSYTNFVNFADWSALALPGGMRNDGLPAGFTLIGPTWHDFALAEFGLRWQKFQPWSRGALGTSLPATPAATPPCPADWIRFAVVGAHLEGMPLNYQLTERKARFVEHRQSAADYQFYALADSVPAKPGMVRVKQGSGTAIALEIWEMPISEFGSFVSLIPSPLGIGTLRLDDDSEIKGFICEGFAVGAATNISHFGGWRNYLTNAGSTPS